MWWWTALAMAGEDPCANPSAHAAEIRAAFDAANADRASRSPDTYKNDARRIKEMLALHKAGGICTPVGRYLAAGVLQYSQVPDEIKVSYDLALEAMNGHAPNAANLVALVFDRWKVSRGLAQWYGTMFSQRDGQRCIFEVDPAATDAQRADHGVASLADTYARVLADAGKAGYEPTTESLVRYDLVCESKAWR